MSYCKILYLPWELIQGGLDRGEGAKARACIKKQAFVLIVIQGHPIATADLHKPFPTSAN